MEPDPIAAPGARLSPRMLAPLLACALACAPARVPAQSSAVEARIAGQEAQSPKWVYLGERVVGICPDILAAVQRIEPRLRFTGYRQSRSLPGIEAGLENGSLELACALMPTPRREAVAVRVGPVLYVAQHRLAARSNDPAEVASIGDLARMKALVVGQRGGVFTAKLKAAGVLIDDATDDNAVNLRKVLAGHGRFVEMNDLTLRHYLRSGDLERRMRILPVVMGDEPAYFWVSRKADPAIGRLLGAALDKLKASGELDRIYAQRAANP